MIVEDDQDTREILCSILRRKFPAVDFLSAANGREGVELFAERRPQIVVTDLNMPGMGGAWMIRAIREMSPETMFIVVTADTGKGALVEALGEEKPIDHYVFKPVDYATLFLAISRCLAKLQEDR
ncbi:response regulator [Geomonas sp. Red32]|uniref:response regulator transcription factor n=1 Tax=Geomonas sp. Red32 TaxID=2912856 RepID=UPI00202CE6E9|nr:response regulator [Geomonas sp. Red32]MCM0082249.1 response regulator [Geomonas sp. Red32]